MSRADGRSTVPGPGRLGLVEPPAAGLLGDLGWVEDNHVDLLWALSRCADPDLALRSLSRLATAAGPGWGEIELALLGDEALRARLFGVLGASTLLGDHVVANPSSWRLLTRTGPLPGADELRSALLSAVGAPGVGPGAVSALRRAYRDQVLMLAARDLAAVVQDEPVLTYPQVSAHLSELAGAALTAALAVARARVCPSGPCPRLAVVAMGKCGGRELNYVSDVDVLFVAEPADRTAERLAGETMAVTRTACFDVDANLRPEGRSGPVVRTVDSYLAYYRRWATTWEFQALLKARPLTGDAELGEAFVAGVSPMVWSASDRADFVPDVQAMRRRVEASVPTDLRRRELKLGYGGLRDVEFAVQLLQLVHGGDDDSLRDRNTTVALGALAVGGYVGRDDAANLVASYEFLRLLEHRLQLQRMRRTHLLPDPADEDAMRWLARAAHVRPDGRYDATGVLSAELRRNTARVRRLHEKLFYRPLLAAVAAGAQGSGRLGLESAARRLAVLGYLYPDAALNHLRALTDGVTRAHRIQAVLLPTLLDWLSATADPDGGLLAYRRLSEARADSSWYLRSLRDEPAVAQRLMHVLGTSAYATELVIRAPDVLRRFDDSATGPRLLEVGPDEVAAGLRASAARHPDPERAVAAARALRRQELARVATADLLGLLEVAQVCRALSSVWAAVLDAAVGAVAAAGGPPPGRLAVIGLGRLGGAELGYGSDADVLFVCEPADGGEPDAALQWAAGVVDRARRLLSAASADPPLEVDTGLRPEGRNGPVVRTLAAYVAYYRQWAQPWEIQALVRAAPIAGDIPVGRRFIDAVDPLRYPAGGMPQAGIREIRRIKARVDTERLPRGADPAMNTKLGRGGLSDVEWTAQLLQLRHGHRVPALRTTSTIDALGAAADAGVIARADADALREAWLLATRTRNALVLVRGRPTDQLPLSGRQLAAVAVAAGRGDREPGAFLDDYRKATRRARAVVERVFY